MSLAALLAGCGGGGGGTPATADAPTVNNLAGGWLCTANGVGSIAIVFYGSSQYVMITPAAGLLSGAFEDGTYTLNAAAGTMSPTAVVNDDGTYGLSDVGASITARYTNRDLVLGSSEYARVQRSATNPIVGTWHCVIDAKSTQTVDMFAILLDDGRFFSIIYGTGMTEERAGGVEIGTYTWNSTTHAVTFNASDFTTLGNDGLAGLGNSLTAEVTNNTMTLRQGQETWAFNRVGE